MLREPQQSSSVSEVSEVIIDVPCIWRCFLPQPYFKGRKKISQIPNPPEKQVTKPVNQGNHRHINTALLHTRHHHTHSCSGATPPSLYGIDLYYFARKALLLHEASSTGRHHHHYCSPHRSVVVTPYLRSQMHTDLSQKHSPNETTHPSCNKKALSLASHWASQREGIRIISGGDLRALPSEQQGVLSHR